MTPRIFVYESRDAPEAQRFIGRFQASDGGQMPIVFTGADADGVRRRMTEWWAAEQEKLVAKAAGKAARREQPKSRVQAVAEDIFA